MEKCLELDSFVNNIKAILPLANCHMVDFITEDLFVNMLPKCLQEELMSFNAKELNDIARNRSSNTISGGSRATHLNEFLDKADMLSLKRNKFCCCLDDLYDRFISKGFSEVEFNQLKQYMSGKKSHEVDIMSSVIAAIAQIKNCSHIVDIGGGKGYLGSVLSLHYRLKVLSVDSSTNMSKGAAKHLPKVERFLAVQQKSKFVCDNKEDGSTIDAEKHCAQLCKLATTYVSESTDLVNLIREHYLEDEVGDIMLIGLHTCGNLGSSSLRLFSNNPENIRCLINVGCCYNLLIEEYDSTPLWLKTELNNSGYGFPMSTYLKNLRFCLGRNARMLASQSPDREYKGLLQTESLFYRALLEFYLQKKLGSTNNYPQFRVGKLAKKCSNFVEYAQKSIKQLGLNIPIDEDELKQLYDEHEMSKKQLHAFFLLRLALAPAIEAAVLLDRLMYLHEQGIEAYLIQLFDPVVSPRCYAILAFNK